MKGERGYGPKIDRVLDACGDFTERDFADLACAAADQAGLSVQEQIRLGRALEIATGDAVDDRPTQPMDTVVVDVPHEGASS